MKGCAVKRGMRKKHHGVGLRGLKGNGLGERILLEPEKGLEKKAEGCEQSHASGFTAQKTRGLGWPQ